MLYNFLVIYTKTINYIFIFYKHLHFLERIIIMLNYSKTILLALLVSGLLITATGCGSPTSDNGDSVSSNQQIQTEESKKEDSEKSDLDESAQAEQSNQNSEESSSEKSDTNEEISDISNKELTDLFSSALDEINDLAYDEPIFVVKNIFKGKDVQYKSVEVDNHPYLETTIDYNMLVDYYAITFTDKALEWILSTKFLNVDGKLYCSAVGGASGIHIENISIEKIQDNKYKATFSCYHFSEEECKTQSNFEIKKTNDGYRISSIDYCPTFLKPALWNIK